MTDLEVIASSDVNDIMKKLRTEILATPSPRNESSRDNEGTSLRAAGEKSTSGSVKLEGTIPR